MDHQTVVVVGLAKALEKLQVLTEFQRLRHWNARIVIYIYIYIYICIYIVRPKLCIVNRKQLFCVSSDFTMTNLHRNLEISVRHCLSKFVVETLLF